jgi:hypothetical protein
MSKRKMGIGLSNEMLKQVAEEYCTPVYVYHAEKIDSNYQRIISMHDFGETDQDGSLIVANYGRGKFVYTGIAFFRQLPAGVRGAYKLFANLLASPLQKSSQKKQSSLKKVPKI